MTFSQFKAAIGSQTFFKAGIFGLGCHRFSRWSKKGLIVRLDQGLYRLAEMENYDPMELAAVVAPDSYITSWSALGYLGYLDERYLGPVCSAITRKSFLKEVEGRHFQFKRNNREKFRDTSIPEGKLFRIATPVTAFLDLVHRRFTPLQPIQGIAYHKFDPKIVLQLLLSARLSPVRPKLGLLLSLCRAARRRKLALEAVRKQLPSSLSHEEWLDRLHALNHHAWPDQ